MANQLIRSDKRSYDQLRPLKVTYDIFSYASGSTLFEVGNTKVLCSVTLQQGTPHFLRGKKLGWLTAEYSLLPSSTPTRTVREITANKRSGRTIEISRLIGRTLRSIIDFTQLADQTIFIDCDVLQADGGTRSACITGAYLALKKAVQKWINEGIVKESILIDEIAAISVGTTNEIALLDLDFFEDNIIDADFNYVLTRSGKVIEIQGSAEKTPISWDMCDNMKALAIKGATDIFDFYDYNSNQIEKKQENVSSVSKSLYRSLFE